MELVGFTLQIGCVVRRRGEEIIGRSIATRRVALLLADFLLTEHFLSVLNETRVDSHYHLPQVGGFRNFREQGERGSDWPDSEVG